LNLFKPVPACLFIIVSLVFLFSETPDAKVYKWVDEQGKPHFTDNKSKIPSKFRNQGKQPPNQPSSFKKSSPTSPSGMSSNAENLSEGKPFSANFSYCREGLKQIKSSVHISYLKKTFQCPDKKAIRAIGNWQCQPSAKQGRIF